MSQNEIFSSLNVDYENVNGILIATYKKGVSITLELAKKNVKDRIEFTKGKSYPILIKDYGVTLMEKEARTYLSSEEATNGIKAAAFVFNSVFSMFIINFFTKVNPPTMPVKAFGNETDAINWLEQYKSNSLNSINE